jgi:hypothetical protein
MFGSQDRSEGPEPPTIRWWLGHLWSGNWTRTFTNAEHTLTAGCHASERLDQHRRLQWPETCWTWCKNKPSTISVYYPTSVLSSDWQANIFRDPIHEQRCAVVLFMNLCPRKEFFASIPFQIIFLFDVRKYIHMKASVCMFAQEVHLSKQHKCHDRIIMRVNYDITLRSVLLAFKLQAYRMHLQ